MLKRENLTSSSGQSS